MESRTIKMILVAVCAAVLLPASAEAVLVDFTIEANAAQEVHAVTSPGTGAGWLQLDTDTNAIQWSFIYSNLTGPVTGAHFHGPADVGVNGPALIALDGSSSPMMDSTIIDNTMKMQLLAGDWYINLHTDAYPQGEIRGQLERVVPEPATVALLGLGGIFAAVRRKR